MTTFITGGSSSIGRVLIKEMAREGEKVKVLARPSSNLSGLDLPGVEFIYGDVTDPQAVKEAMQGCEHVTHMAAVVGQQVAEETWWRVNRDGSRNVLQAARELDVRSLVQVSTISVLGPTQAGEIADESRAVDTSKYFNLYQKTKRAADDLAREYAARSLRAMIVYPCFGFGCSWASSHPSMQEQTLLRMAAGKPVANLGSGKNRLCFSYYKDTARGIRLAHERGQAGEDYILGGDNLTFTEIWAAVAKVLGKKPPRRRIPLFVFGLISEASKFATGRSILPPEFFEMVSLNWCFSSAKAKQELGYQPLSFEQGIAETWAEYQSSGWQA
ncbi:MAG: NAD-dependent epimerase/dehydratase family protein [Anaerolineales bacterium]|nr:NAD-dependent epimerase/dehydratase family protein [Anaerolineales bacterium]